MLYKFFGDPWIYEAISEEGTSGEIPTENLKNFRTFVRFFHGIASFEEIFEEMPGQIPGESSRKISGEVSGRIPLEMLKNILALTSIPTLEGISKIFQEESLE